jgi:hypothetical protein
MSLVKACVSMQPPAASCVPSPVTCAAYARATSSSFDVLALITRMTTAVCCARAVLCAHALICASLAQDVITMTPAALLNLLHRGHDYLSLDVSICMYTGCYGAICSV